MPMMEYYNAVESQGLSGDGDTETLGDQHLWPADLRDDIIHPQLVTNTSEWFPSKGDDTVDQQDGDDDDDNDGRSAESILPEGPDHQSTSTSYSTSNDGGDKQITDPTLTTAPHQSQSNVDSPSTSDSVISPPPASTPIEPEEPTKSSETDHATSPATSPTTIDTVSISNESEDTADETSHITNSITISENITSTTYSNVDQDPTTSNTVVSATIDPVDAAAATATATTNTNESPNRPSDDATVTQPDVTLNTPKPTPDISTFTSIDPTSSEVPSPPVPGDDTRPKVMPNSHNKEPATQESIYKIIMKRLNALEANATLSQRYLDEQNNMLNDVFTEMERRHQDQLILVLDRLNETASSRIDSMVMTENG